MSMIKVVPPGSFDFHAPVASLMDVYSHGVDRPWMQKRGAVLSDAIRGIRSEKDAAFIHLISMGAMEYYGSNRNGDGFNEKQGTFEFPEPKSGVNRLYQMAGGLIEYHPTFMKRGFVYKHHQNTDPMKKIGMIHAESYNPEMHRGELIIKVPLSEKKAEEMGCIPHPWAEKVAKMADGKDIPFSMACKVAFDVCTICGNQARNRAEYCKHAADHLGEITKQGHLICVINDAPGFFDISDVFKPADRIAYSLRKVAADLAIGGAALAEELGVTLPDYMLDFSSKYGAAKLAIARKLAEIEKQVDAIALAKHNPHIKQLIPGTPSGRIPAETMGVLKGARLDEALGALGESGILLSPQDFFELVTGAKTASVTGDISVVPEVLPGFYNRLLSSGEIDECAADSAYDSSNTAIPRRVKEAVLQIEKDHSQFAECAEYRARKSVVCDQAPTFKTASVKQAALSASSSLLAKEYAKYQLSFAREATGNLTNGLTVLQNYLSR